MPFLQLGQMPCNDSYCGTKVSIDPSLYLPIAAVTTVIYPFPMSYLYQPKFVKYDFENDV